MIDILININENVSFPFSGAWICRILGFGGHGLNRFVKFVIKNYNGTLFSLFKEILVITDPKYIQ